MKTCQRPGLCPGPSWGSLKRWLAAPSLRNLFPLSALRALPLTRNRRLGRSQHEGLDPPMPGCLLQTVIRKGCRGEKVYAYCFVWRRRQI